MRDQSSLVKALGLKYPIIQAPMAGATNAKMVACVSNAGGLGSLGAGYMPGEQILEEVKAIKCKTNNPFAVNLFIPKPVQVTSLEMHRAQKEINTHSQYAVSEVKPPYTPDFNHQIEALLKEPPPVFSFTFGLLDVEHLEALQKKNIQVIGTATTVAEAFALENLGVDAICLQGEEAGGHRGSFLSDPLTSLSPLETLLNDSKQSINLPLIASGGIMSADDIHVKLEKGASAVAIGTAFLTTDECPISQAQKNEMLNQTEDSTVLTAAFSGKYARGIRNHFTEKMEKSLHRLPYPAQNALTTAMRCQAKAQADINFMSIWAGQRVSDCKALSVEALMTELCSKL